MIRVGELLICCDNLALHDMLKIVGKNKKVIIKTVGECLLTREIKNLNVECFYISRHSESVISVKEDL